MYKHSIISDTAYVNKRASLQYRTFSTVKMPEIIQPYSLEEEYKKKTGITRQDIAKLRNWLETQPHLPAEAITDMDLILTFHCCRRSAEVSKQLVDLYFTLRALFTNFFKNRQADAKLLKTMANYLILPLETKAYDDSKVVYCRLMDYDYKNFVFADAVKCVIMIIDLWQYMEGTWPGLVILIDMDQVTLGHITRLDVQTVQQFLYYLQEAMLVKLKGLHFLNAPSFMDRVLMILRPFMKKELLGMLQIHERGSKTLDKYVPPEALPKEAGGTYMDFNSAGALVLSKIKAGADFFTAENKKCVTESARPGKPKTISDIFGSVEGSFKKLEID